MPNLSRALIAPLALVSLIAAGCGGSSSSSPSTTAPAANTPATSTTTQAAGGGQAAGALSAEATSAATGDIPDTQMFLTYSSTAGGYAMSYPEGWTQLAAGPDVTIRDKNNLVRVSIRNGAPPTIAAVSAEIARLKAATPSLTSNAPSPIQLKSGPAIKVTYRTQSAPNPVTNKRVLLIVDRYELAHNGKVATVDLGTPQGVDNVDAYKMMINSFKWR
jgi:hypothetical protein